MARKHSHSTSRRRRERGFTLIELMVSLLIGFAVVGALLAAYMASFRSSSHSEAMTQITEDATLALNVIRSQAAMAGYSNVVGVSGGKMTKYAFTPIFGCPGSSFGDPAPDIRSAVPCAGTSPSDTLEVAYEAGAGDASIKGSSNSILSAAGKPLDCEGSELKQEVGVGGGPLFFNDSKFYVDNGKLYCKGSGSTAAAPLVDNVEALSITYGVGASGTGQIDHYTKAPGPPTGGVWDDVMSVTICVVVRSAGPILEPGDSPTTNTLTTYIDCAGNVQKPSDNLLRRSFSTTVVLQNKVLSS